MSRVFERILVKELTFYLTKYSLLSNSQFGFRSGKSVEIQLLKCYSQWITAIDEHRFIDIIYLDYAKAFDKVSHTKLLVKLCNRSVFLKYCILD